jgi:hypothetical protein
MAGGWRRASWTSVESAINSSDLRSMAIPNPIVASICGGIKLYFGRRSGGAMWTVRYEEGLRASGFLERGAIIAGMNVIAQRMV